MEDERSRSETERRTEETPREGLRGGPVTERERPDGGQIRQREALEGDPREDTLPGSRSGGMENRPGDRSDPMPGTSGSSR